MALLVAGFWPIRAAQADDSLPVPWNGMDIGGQAGVSQADHAAFTVTASGGDISGASDQFHYVYQSITGDFALVARVTSGPGPQEAAKAGLMVRDALATTSDFVAVVRTLAPGVLYQYRTPNFRQAGMDAARASGPVWVRLVKRGTAMSGYTAADVNGAPGTWRKVGGDQPTSSGMVYIGLCLTGHGPGMAGTALFDHVALSPGPQPALDDGTYVLAPASAPALVLSAAGTGVALAAPAGQAWVFTNKGDGRYDVQPASDPSRALAVAGGKTADGARIVLQADQNLPTERWSVVPNDNGTFGLVLQSAPGSGLDDLGGNATPAAVIDLWTRWATDPHTQWTITPAPEREPQP